MDIKIINQDGVSMVRVEGRLDGTTSTQAQERIIPLVVPGVSLVVDMTRCDYVSSAGLRLLLFITKQIFSKGGKIALAGVSDEVKDVMEMTGFGGFFKSYAAADEAVQAVKS